MSDVLKLSLEEEFKVIEKNFKNKAGSNYAASRGEYLNGIIIAATFPHRFLNLKAAPGERRITLS